MKIIRFLGLVFLVTIISLFSGFLLSYRAQGLLNTRYNPPEIALANFQQPPEKVLFSKALDFADIAWKTFVTLNWPANDDGSPLENFVLGQAPVVPRVWEFYRRPEEVFLPNGESPLLNTPNPLATTLNIDLFEGQGSGLETKSDLQENSKFLAENSRVNLEENLLNSRAWIKKVIDSNYKCQGKNNSICDDTEKNNFVGEANKLVLNNIPIVDQKGNYIIVEMHLNGNEFNQIVNNEWYKASKLAEYDDEKNRFQFESTTASIDAPIEIKAAWRVFDENSSPGEKARYYTTKRVLAIPADKYVCTTDNCGTDPPALETDPPVLKEVEVGLIGFHIAYKIPQQEVSAPGWIWATFEQVDNLQVDNPPPGIDLKPTLSNPGCETNANKENSDQENCLPNYPYVEWPFLWRDQSPHAVTRQDGQIKEQIPTQVQRLSKSSTLSDAVKKDLKQQNKNWQEAFRNVTPDSVWQYYQLVGTQWLQNPRKITDTPLLPRDKLMSNIRLQQVQPGALVNVSMEAYSQTKVNGDSCIGCHVAAILQSSSDNSQKVTSDFSFLLERAESSSDNLSKEVK